MKKGSKHSEETKRKMSERRLSEEHKKKISKFMKGRHHSPKTEFKKGHNKGSNHPQWKENGQIKHSAGYIYIRKPSHPFANERYVFEHRLIVEAQIGHYLAPENRVHHLNEIKDDNRPENLIAFISESAHQRFHHNPDNVKPSEIIFDGRLLTTELLLSN